ncbi:unnamed protein product, partial [Phaeothamnion confervicola]
AAAAAAAGTGAAFTAEALAVLTASPSPAASGRGPAAGSVHDHPSPSSRPSSVTRPPSMPSPGSAASAAAAGASAALGAAATTAATGSRPGSSRGAADAGADAGTGGSNVDVAADPDFLFRSGLYGLKRRRQRRRGGKRARLVEVGRLPESTLDDPDPILPPSHYLVRLDASRGLGLSLEIVGSKVCVKGFATVEDGGIGPAQLCGLIRAGDQLVGVNTQDLTLLSFTKIIDQLRGLLRIRQGWILLRFAAADGDADARISAAQAAEASATGGPAPPLGSSAGTQQQQQLLLPPPRGSASLLGQRGSGVVPLLDHPAAAVSLSPPNGSGRSAVSAARSSPAVAWRRRQRRTRRVDAASSAQATGGASDSVSGGPAGSRIGSRAGSRASSRAGSPCLERATDGDDDDDDAPLPMASLPRDGTLDGDRRSLHGDNYRGDAASASSAGAAATVALPGVVPVAMQAAPSLEPRKASRLSVAVAGPDLGWGSRGDPLRSKSISPPRAGGPRGGVLPAQVQRPRGSTFNGAAAAAATAAAAAATAAAVTADGSVLDAAWDTAAAMDGSRTAGVSGAAVGQTAAAATAAAGALPTPALPAALALPMSQAPLQPPPLGLGWGERWGEHVVAGRMARERNKKGYLGLDLPAEASQRRLGAIASDVQVLYWMIASAEISRYFFNIGRSPLLAPPTDARLLSDGPPAAATAAAGAATARSAGVVSAGETAMSRRRPGGAVYVDLGLCRGLIARELSRLARETAAKQAELSDRGSRSAASKDEEVAASGGGGGGGAGATALATAATAARSRAAGTSGDGARWGPYGASDMVPSLEVVFEAIWMRGAVNELTSCVDFKTLRRDVHELKQDIYDSETAADRIQYVTIQQLEHHLSRLRRDEVGGPGSCGGGGGGGRIGGADLADWSPNPLAIDAGVAVGGGGGGGSGGGDATGAGGGGGIVDGAASGGGDVSVNWPPLQLTHVLATALALSQGQVLSGDAEPLLQLWMRLFRPLPPEDRPAVVRALRPSRGRGGHRHKRGGGGGGGGGGASGSGYTSGGSGYGSG